MSIASNGVGIGLAAPDFELKSICGELVKLSDFSVKPVLLFFIQKSNRPHLQRMVSQYRNLIEVIGSMAQPLMILEHELGQTGALVPMQTGDLPSMNCPVLYDHKGRMLDKYNFYKLAGLEGYQLAHPNLFLLSGNRTIIFSYVGDDPFAYHNFELIVEHIQGQAVLNGTHKYTSSHTKPAQPVLNAD